ncbi:MAG: hypothetical protein ACI9WU_003412 [Myxococcota bacterium]|jgi:hypothetical protein
MSQGVRVALSWGLKHAQPLLDFNGAGIPTKIVRFTGKLLGIRVGARLPDLSQVQLSFSEGEAGTISLDGHVKRQQVGAQTTDLYVRLRYAWTEDGEDLLVAFVRDTLEVTREGMPVQVYEKGPRIYYDLGGRKKGGSVSEPRETTKNPPKDEAWTEFGGGEWGPDPKKRKDAATRTLEKREERRRAAAAAGQKRSQPAPADENAARAEPRAAAKTSVLVRVEGKAREATVRDVSENGLCLMLQGDEPAPGAEIRLTHPVVSGGQVVGMALDGYAAWSVAQPNDTVLVGVELEWRTEPDPGWGTYVAAQQARRRGRGSVPVSRPQPNMTGTIPMEMPEAPAGWPQDAARKRITAHKTITADKSTAAQKPLPRSSIETAVPVPICGSSSAELEVAKAPVPNREEEALKRKKREDDDDLYETVSALDFAALLADDAADGEDSDKPSHLRPVDPDADVEVLLDESEIWDT